FKYLFRRKFWHFLLIVVLSSSFHTSMLFLVPIYWISNLKLSTRQYVFIYILFFVSFSSREVIMTLLYPMTLIHPILLSRFDSYSEVSDVSAASGYSLGLL
ncbi:EpsG family protein, partial [Bacteroides fragilis]